MEVINGISVPPEPAPATNTATVAGVDVNSNGVRDDVERYVATEYGKSPEKLQSALLHAKAQQKLVTGDRAGYLSVICGPSYAYSKDLDRITSKTIDTAGRRAALKGLTDTPISINVSTGGCK